MKGIISKLGLLLGGVGLGILSVGALYETLRKDYNQLVDKYNELSDFVDKHDFYEKEIEPSVSKISEYVYKVDFER